MKNRLYNRLYALVHGYFWLPCLLCKNKFGGHEWKDGTGLMNSYSSGEEICPDCADKAAEMNKENFPRFAANAGRPVPW